MTCLGIEDLLSWCSLTWLVNWWRLSSQDPPWLRDISFSSFSCGPLPEFIGLPYHMVGSSYLALVVKNMPTTAGDVRCGFSSWIGKIPWRRAWQLTPVSLPWNSHGQRSLADYCPLGHTESHRVRQDWSDLARTAWWLCSKGKHLKRTWWKLYCFSCTNSGGQVVSQTQGRENRP